MNRVGHVLVARLDSDGDVLLAGPAVRAVAAAAERVTFLCSPRGRAAAELLPGVDRVLVHRAPWIEADPDPLERDATLALVDRLASMAVDQGVILTSFHQSPLPLALLLRMAGVGRLGATSVDYPGSLLDVRHRIDDDVHEVERSLSLAAAMGFSLPDGDPGHLQVRRPDDARAPAGLPGGVEPPYVVVHPGASVTARAWAPSHHAALVDLLVAAGRRVVVTGGPAERHLTALVAGHHEGGEVVDLGGSTDLAELATLLDAADAVVVGNTGPAHLAAAVGTPVVSLFAPTVPAVRWRPWKVPSVLLGDADIPCAGCRARVCPVEGHPCLSAVTPAQVVAALDRLAPAPAPEAPGRARPRRRFGPWPLPSRVPDPHPHPRHEPGPDEQSQRPEEDMMMTVEPSP